MIKPIQRVMKYPLLLCELRNSTPPSHPDFRALEEAFAAVKDINININELKRRKDLGKKRRWWIVYVPWLECSVYVAENQNVKVVIAVTMIMIICYLESEAREGIVVLPCQLGSEDHEAQKW